ncbi:MAG: leucine-rich repeat domain-containing protein [Promethearchaeota archaeon]
MIKDKVCSNEMLSIEEKDALCDLENVIKGSLPITEYKEGPGVLIENGHVLILNLYDQKIILLPESIGKFKFLQILNLRNNQLVSLPESIGALKSLLELDVCWNKLSFVPESISQLTVLSKIDFSYNELINLPDSIGLLKSLKELYLNNNKLVFLPDSIGALRRLKILKIDDNKLSTLPESMELLYDISEISVDDNGLTQSCRKFLKSFEARGCRIILPESQIFEEKFRFFSNNVFLTAWLDTETGKQKLVMQKLNPETKEVVLEDKIDCVHTAVSEIPISDFSEVVSDENFEKRVLNVTSSEKLWEINLDIDEKFKAFKSWVAGIAEAGTDAFKIQTEIDIAAKQMYPLAERILRFMAMADSFFIPEFLLKVAQECVYEGVRHDVCLIANFTPILEMLIYDPLSGKPKPDLKNWEYIEEDNIYYLNGYRQILSVMFDLNIPLRLFTQNSRFIGFLRLPDAVKIPNFRDAFYHSDPRVRKAVALNSEAVDFEDFNNFLFYKSEPNILVRRAATKNPNSMKIYKTILKNSGLPMGEIDALWEIAALIGKPIPRVNDFIWDDEYETVKKDVDQHLGVIIENKHVVGLGIVFQEKMLTYIPDVIGDFKYMQHMSLYHNNLVHLPKTLGKLVSLKSLSLGHNKLKFLPESIGKLKNLQKLCLNTNLLSSLPESITSLSELMDLNIKNNLLKEIPIYFQELKSLRVLNLEKNQISYLPDFIGNYPLLRNLLLSVNNLEKIPESIGNLERLQQLYLGANQIVSLPESIGNLKSLYRLLLYTNKLNSLPKSVTNLTNLRYLNITFNNFFKIPNSIEILKKKGCEVIFSVKDYKRFDLTNQGILEAFEDYMPYTETELVKKMKITKMLDVRTLRKKIKQLMKKNLIITLIEEGKVFWKRK